MGDGARKTPRAGESAQLRVCLAHDAPGSHIPGVSISKRLWDVARANVTDFASAFMAEDAGVLTEAEREQLRREAEQDADTVGGKAGAAAGKAARKMRDKAEEAWERAFEAAQARNAKAGYATRIDPTLERLRWYRTLEVSPEASMDETRSSYRRLLRKYHPDRYANDPEKLRAATEVARKITEAYNGIKQQNGAA